MLNQLPIIVLNKRRKNPASSTNENIDAPTHRPIHPPTLARNSIFLVEFSGNTGRNTVELVNKKLLKSN